MGAKVQNPRKQFQFRIIIPGMNPFLAQDVKLPDVEFDATEHGDTGYMVKTAGMKKVGMLSVTKICPADSLDTNMRIWGKQIMDTRLGGGAPPSLYKKPILVEELGNDGISVIERHTYSGCWPQKLNGKELSRKSSENTVESIEFCVDEEE